MFHWDGRITFADRKRNFFRISSYCAEHGVDCVLIDGRDQVSETDIVELYNLGVDVPQDMRGLKIAVVHRPDDESLRLIATVAFNRGANTRAFLDFDEAQQWLVRSSEV